MNDDDLKSIENALGVKLPVEYLTVLTRADAQEAGFWYGGLFNDPKRVISETLELREITASFNRRCPDSWVVVSEVNSGDVVFIDVGEPNCALRYCDHETMEVADFRDTVEHFADSTIEAMRQTEV